MQVTEIQHIHAQVATEGLQHHGPSHGKIRDFHNPRLLDSILNIMIIFGL
jgi:hypothetical protein